MPAPAVFAQQPRWLLLSVFLFLWSLSSGLRRDGRAPRALGLGVDARAHIPVADDLVVPEEYAPSTVWKRDAILPGCAAVCASQAAGTIGCGAGLNLGCACHSPSFLPDTVNCMDKNCTSIDEQVGQQALQSACLAIGEDDRSSAIVHQQHLRRLRPALALPKRRSRPQHAFRAANLSCHGPVILTIRLLVGPPPICTTGSPTSGSDTTTVSVTVTVTSTSPASSGSGASPSSSPSASGSDTSSVPVVTTTAMITSSSTVLMPTGSTTHPVTTVTSTSTLGSVPTDGTGNGMGATGTGTGDGQTGAAARMKTALGETVVAALVAVAAVWVL
ncbi:hypothetical protein GY45DRAFT_1344161 [Cubamyces sp. BRFM 1775]|nr:hypothetical protein GY45DRAFT_1344161 [Cubamyces sp. BRFM 1775]